MEAVAEGSHAVDRSLERGGVELAVARAVARAEVADSAWVTSRAEHRMTSMPARAA